MQSLFPVPKFFLCSIQTHSHSHESIREHLGVQFAGGASGHITENKETAFEVVISNLWKLVQSWYKAVLF